MAINIISTVPTSGGTFSTLSDTKFASVSISPSKVLIIFMQTSPNAMYAQIINLSGASVPVLGPVTLINNSVVGNDPGIRVSMLSSSKAYVSFRQTDSTESAGVHGQILVIDGSDNITQGPVSSALFSAHQEYGFNAVSTTSAIFCAMDGSLSAGTRTFNTWHVPVTGNIIGAPTLVKTETSSVSVDGFNVLSIADGSGSYIAFILGVATLYNSSNTQIRIITGINNNFLYTMLLDTNKVLAISKAGLYHTIDITTDTTDVDTLFANASDDLNMVSMLKINNETIFTLGVDNVPNTLAGAGSAQRSHVFRNVGPGLAILNENNPFLIIPNTWITPRSTQPSRHTQLHFIDANHIAFISLFSVGPSSIVFNIFEQL